MFVNACPICLLERHENACRRQLGPPLKLLFDYCFSEAIRGDQLINEFT
jgi:hypothetical protein